MWLLTRGYILGKEDMDIESEGCMRTYDLTGWSKKWLRTGVKDKQGKAAWDQIAESFWCQV